MKNESESRMKRGLKILEEGTNIVENKDSIKNTKAKNNEMKASGFGYKNDGGSHNPLCNLI